MSAATPTSRERRRVQSALGQNPVLVTWVMLAANVAIFFATHELADFGYRSLRSSATRDWSLFAPAIDVDGEWWRMLTSAFLHVDFRHLAMNGVFLVLLGVRLERSIGAGRFIGVYLVSALGGAVGALLVSPTAVTVGASGAVFGLMGAAYVVERMGGGDPWSSGLGTLIMLQVIVSFLIPGVSVGGHLGGLAAGASAAALLGPAAQPGRHPARAIGVAVLMSLAMVGAGILIAPTWTNPLL